MSSPMKPVGPKCGLRFFWADRKVFTKPGLYVWLFKRNLRIWPLPKRSA